MNNLVIASLLMLASCSVFAFEQDTHEHDHKEVKEINEHAEKVVELTQQQMKLANITIAELHATSLAKPLYSPGEVKANGYTSYYVSPRVESVVLKRHAMLGQQVVQGEPLVTLFSESVAQAQADYKVAYSDWQRLKNLTSSTVSEKEKLVSQTAYFAAQGRLKAYGLNEQDIKGLELLSNNNLGEYVLYAERGGAVLSDDFHQGQRIDAGTALMVLTDEKKLWVEAQLTAYDDIHLPIGSLAVVALTDQKFIGKVIQSAHTIDASTRTRIVRIEVENTNHILHPGMFVDVLFSKQSSNKVTALPQSALIRSQDGHWQVFIEQAPGKFKAVEVDLGGNYNSPEGSDNTLWQQVFGLPVGVRVVKTGAFFIASQAAKSSFDSHNH